MSIDAEDSVSSRARELLRDCLVRDYHGCMPLRPADDSFLPQLERYRRAGVDVVMLRVGFGDQGVEEHIRMLAALHAWLLSRPSEHVLIDGMDDVHLARSSSRLAVGFDIEGANATADQISLVALYHSLGVRWMLLADNRNNRVGGGCRDDDPSLKAFVRDVVREMVGSAGWCASAIPADARPWPFCRSQSSGWSSRTVAVGRSTSTPATSTMK